MPVLEGEAVCREMPDLFSSEARLPYSRALSRFASRICSDRDTWQLWLIVPLRFSPVELEWRVPLELRCRWLSYSWFLAETTGCSSGDADVFYFSRLAAAAPEYFARFDLR